MHHPRSIRSSCHRLGVVVATGVVLGTGGLVALLSIGGHASADQQTRDTLPPADIFVDDDDPSPTITIPPHITGPIIPLPGDDDSDGPIYTGPIIPLPQDDDGPIVTGPTIPLPDDSAAPGETPAPGDPAAPGESSPPGNTTAPVAPAEPDAPTSAAPFTDDVAPFLEITSATVDCDGVLHVTYETGATPEPAPAAEHVVTFSPTGNPDDVVAHRLQQRPINSVFTVDMQAPLADTYRVVVVADFEPANLDGTLLVDELDAPAPVDCPAPAG